MADHTGDQQKESTEASLMDKITEKFHDHDSSSSSDDDSDHEKSSSTTKIYRLFGREKPVHKVLGGGKLTGLKCYVFVVMPFGFYISNDLSLAAADVFLWRDKKISGGVLSVATAVWVLFELVEYHLLTLVCHVLIFGLAILFLWSNASTFIKKSPPQIPEVEIPDDIVLGIASALTTEINRALSVLRDITSGRDLKKFLAVIAGLWVLSCVGSWCNFLTLFYISFVLLHTVPVLYEKYEDHIDPLAEKASAEFKKQYAVFDAKVLSKIPRGPLKDKKVA
ncbi:hypothetical protein RHMOL_Rhmol09G0263600 [Rhododendron molle]|uniref:Uncharacterized protein n=1 Tax=Rhododendron molle TaxID=49168 RepID=A0ACC0MHH4_RHOML|nr:hypothetical protein RHMOL_Rhmol09G0263600 [Rhododendron molle]